MEDILKLAEIIGNINNKAMSCFFLCFFSTLPVLWLGVGSMYCGLQCPKVALNRWLSLLSFGHVFPSRFVVCIC